MPNESEKKLYVGIFGILMIYFYTGKYPDNKLNEQVYTALFRTFHVGCHAAKCYKIK